MEKYSKHNAPTHNHTNNNGQTHKHQTQKETQTIQIMKERSDQTAHKHEKD